MAKGEIDLERSSVLSDERDVFCHAIWGEIPPEEGGNFWRRIKKSTLNLNISIGGRGRRDVLQGISGSKGVVSGVEFAKRPGWIGRNVTQKDWKEEADKEGKVIVE